MPPNQSTRLRSFEHAHVRASAHRILDIFDAAAQTFVKTSKGTTEIWAASRNWFLEEWGRDTFIALPGLLLTRRQWAKAKSVFRHFAASEKNGLIPNRIREDEVLYNTVDASLWFIHALSAYEQETHDHAFIKEMLPTCRNILRGYLHGTGYERFGSFQFIGYDPSDGLIASPAQGTWMDADPAGDGRTIVTPRNGKAVEINALWYGSIMILSEWERLHGDKKEAGAWRDVSLRVKQSFGTKFWNEAEHCLLDVIEGDSHGGALRPNQILAVSHGRDILTPQQQKQIVAAVRRDLLTPGGLRSLSPRDSYYRGVYDTSAPIMEKDWAYHQGTVWPWLMGAYCDSYTLVRRHAGANPEQIQSDLELILAPLVQFCLESEYHSLPEVFSGNIPHDPGGTTSQAWSVAEVLRIIRTYNLFAK